MKLFTRIPLSTINVVSFMLLVLAAANLQKVSSAQTAAPAITSTSSSNLNISSSAPTSSSEPDETEPITSTVDSISVNLDESSTLVVGEDSATGNNNSSGAEESSTGEHELLGGIEGKSISSGHESGANILENGNDQTGAKLIDPTSATDGSLVDIGDASGAIASDNGGHFSSQYPAPKPPSHINMSQVDHIYVEARKDEQETVETWHRMGKKLKKGVSNLIGSLVPYALNMSQEAKISSNCSGAMLKWVLSMNQLKSWALRMLDASGKPVAGIMEGSLTMFGNYRQCLKIRAPDDDEIEFAGEFREYFRGKYCIIQAKPWLPEKSRFYNLNSKLKSLVDTNEEGENQWYDRTVFDELSEWALAFNFVNIRMDLCIPSLCTREDIQKAINHMFRGIDLKARVLRCEMDPADGAAFNVAVVESGDTETSGTLTAEATSINPSSAQQGFNLFSQLGWILVPVVAIALVLLATALSVAIGDSNHKTITKFNHTIKSFSLKRSVSSHLNVDYDQLADDKPLSLYGIRFILVLWVILVESAVNLKFEYLRELLMLKDLIFWWPMQFVINSTLQFDSIILLTAFTMSYKNCLNDGINNAKAITRFVLDKYIRLMPSIMVMVALVILLPLVYRGPVWNDYVLKQSAACQSNGWLNTVFLQNYLPYKEICLPQTWLVCIEFQLVLIMAPIVYYLNKNYTNNSSNSNGNYSLNTNGSHHHQKAVKGDQNDTNKLFYWVRTIPGTILVACIAIGLASSFYNVFTNELPPSWFYTMADPDSKAIYFGDHLMRLWTHLAVFAIGILAGVECRRASRNIIRGYRGSNIGLISHGNSLKNQSVSSSSLPAASQSDLMSSKLNSRSTSIDINNTNNSSHENINGSSGSESSENGSSGSLWPLLVDITGCLMAIATMVAIIFSTHDWSLNDLPRPLIAGIFDAGSRFLWSMAMVWILYMVSVPDKDRKFGPLARALGHPAMVCLGKLSFLIYIIHPFVHTTVLAIQEQPIYSSWLMLFHILIGNITITVILASIVSLFVEMPCRNLFRRCGTSLLLTHTVQG